MFYDSVLFLQIATSLREGIYSISIFVCLFVLAEPWGLQDLSSPTRNWTQAMAVKVPSPNHWTAREFPISICRVPSVADYIFQRPTYLSHVTCSFYNGRTLLPLRGNRFPHPLYLVVTALSVEHRGSVAMWLWSPSSRKLLRPPWRSLPPSLPLSLSLTHTHTHTHTHTKCLPLEPNHHSVRKPRLPGETMGGCSDQQPSAPSQQPASWWTPRHGSKQAGRWFKPTDFQVFQLRPRHCGTEIIPAVPCVSS